jgi:hypothetical protein
MESREVATGWKQRGIRGQHGASRRLAPGTAERAIKINILWIIVKGGELTMQGYQGCASIGSWKNK